MLLRRVSYRVNLIMTFADYFSSPGCMIYMQNPHAPDCRVVPVLFGSKVQINLHQKTTIHTH